MSVEGASARFDPAEFNRLLLDIASVPDEAFVPDEGFSHGVQRAVRLLERRSGSENRKRHPRCRLERVQPIERR